MTEVKIKIIWIQSDLLNRKCLCAAAVHFCCCVQCECCKLLIWCWYKHIWNEWYFSNISSVSSVKYLFFCPLCCSWYSVVVFMFIHQTQQANTFLISATENLKELLMFLADHLLQSSSGFSQIVSLSFKPTLMLFKVILTVRVQTHQTGLDGFVFSSSTDITLHISSTSRNHTLKFSLLQFLHHFSQHGVFT